MFTPIRLRSVECFLELEWLGIHATKIFKNLDDNNEYDKTTLRGYMQSGGKKKNFGPPALKFINAKICTHIMLTFNCILTVFICKNNNFESCYSWSLEAPLKKDALRWPLYL